MSSIFLSEEEITELTGKQRQAAQRRVLDMMGVRYMLRPDGKPKIPRAWIEGTAQAQSRPIIALEAIR